jgi:hypothetical protein
MADKTNAIYGWLDRKVHEARGRWMATKPRTVEDKRHFASYERWTAARRLWATVVGEGPLF